VSTPQAVTVERYAGGNETIDRMMTDENVWIVNAHAGRKVLILKPGGGEDDAWEQYLARWPRAPRKSNNA
jgi:hypothetical protein